MAVITQQLCFYNRNACDRKKRSLQSRFAPCPRSLPTQEQHPPKTDSSSILVWICLFFYPVFHKVFGKE